MTRSNADKIPASTPIETDELVLSNTPSARALIREIREIREIRDSEANTRHPSNP